MDRKKVSEIAYAGRAVVGNDAPAPANSPYYPQNFPIRNQNIKEAKKLLAEAGYPHGLDVTVHTSAVSGGMIDFAVVYAQSVEPAGIRVNVHQNPADTYWSDVWEKYPAVVSFFAPANHPALTLSLQYDPGAGFNDTKETKSPIPELVKRAVATSNVQEQRSLYRTAALWVANNGGNVSPAWADWIWAQSHNLTGAQLSYNGAILLEQARFTS
jgi:peptide/nickel transport system substrate-binding protein